MHPESWVRVPDTALTRSSRCSPANTFVTCQKTSSAHPCSWPSMPLTLRSTRCFRTRRGDNMPWVLMKLASRSSLRIRSAQCSGKRPDSGRNGARHIALRQPHQAQPGSSSARASGTLQLAGHEGAGEPADIRSGGTVRKTACPRVTERRSSGAVWTTRFRCSHVVSSHNRIACSSSRTPVHRPKMSRKLSTQPTQSRISGDAPHPLFAPPSC